MKKFFVFLILTLALVSNTVGTPIKYSPAPVEKVYICVSKTAVAYHNFKDCRGLQRCTHEIKTVTKEEAIERGYRACKICY
jgi:hypothetical protein